MRTTLDIADPILEELKSLQKRERISLGQLATSLLAEALRQKQSAREDRAADFAWVSAPMGARVDLRDKDALYRILDQG
jgi:hypothetical protein